MTAPPTALLRLPADLTPAPAWPGPSPWGTGQGHASAPRTQLTCPPPPCCLPGLCRNSFGDRGAQVVHQPPGQREAGALAPQAPGNGLAGNRELHGRTCPSPAGPGAQTQEAWAKRLAGVICSRQQETLARCGSALGVTPRLISRPPPRRTPERQCPLHSLSDGPVSAPPLGCGQAAAPPPPAVQRGARHRWLAPPPALSVPWGTSLHAVRKPSRPRPPCPARREPRDAIGGSGQQLSPLLSCAPSHQPAGTSPLTPGTNPGNTGPLNVVKSCLCHHPSVGSFSTRDLWATFPMEDAPRAIQPVHKELQGNIYLF